MSTPNITPLTYSSYIQTVATMAVIPLTTDAGGYVTTQSAEFNLLIPQMLDYAELRIQRDLDLFASQIDNSSYSLTAGSNLLSVSVNDYVTVQDILITNGTKKTALVPVSKEFLQVAYDDISVTGLPQFFAPYGGDASTFGNTSMEFLFGPYPDQSYGLTLIGTARLPSLAQYAESPQATTSTTFISTWLPDLLLMASMVFISGYQRNFSATSDDPQMAVNYEKQYQTLLKGASVEEARKRFAASGWTSMSPTPVASADRK